MIDEQNFAQQVYHMRDAINPNFKDVQLTVCIDNDDEWFLYWTREDVLLRIYQSAIDTNDTIRFSGIDKTEYRPLDLRKTGEDEDTIYYTMRVDYYE